MTLVVTGTTGHFGRLAVEHLLARGTAASDIVATGRNTATLASLAADLGVRTAVADFDDLASLDAAFAGAEAVLLVSGSEVGRRVAQHTAAIDAVSRAGARLVYTSAPKATTSALILAPEHKATEEAIAAAGIPAVILRNGWYNENYAQTVTELATAGSTLSSAGDGRVASAARSDYAEAAAVALVDASLVGTVHELSGDTAWSFDELATLVGEIAGREASIAHVSAEEHARLVSDADVPEGSVNFIVGLDANIADGLLGATDGSLARLIGHPTTPIRSFVEEQLAR
ncbi:NmrA family NAD(P)-binding protein [Rathayibacter toxicus]|uniref:NAD(P)-dependent oxidoreductase n=1 Tax=Rathayibacter toxicus TaxID=145458 RepID=A0A0C5BCH4_9MICO|nr:NmrA family NAD(P)-binding protein [Rathayibacter toxicus]AJM76876.1 nucleoside-diphosphate sugar epimerase [Rathayibacter toxicus]ALS57356.1 NAD(P)-dependent oxidoreductase [Rathayibacter toxicus]KKM45677.1 nucleoside-diphosphate sugar epimerase [Rathayibacter toxicus]PPG24767.1 NAD(P)-dependent oxidoreductase [Rathayibacter toxicus]PPG48221.1 NAD(P)-dependent oxidoreductase [Rathayibacter toxicus]